VLRPDDPLAADDLLRDRLASAHAKTTSELAASDAASLLPARALVRR
jgi:hypothetical protein